MDSAATVALAHLERWVRRIREYATPRRFNDFRHAVLAYCDAFDHLPALRFEVDAILGSGPAQIETPRFFAAFEPLEVAPPPETTVPAGPASSRRLAEQVGRAVSARWSGFDQLFDPASGRTQTAPESFGKMHSIVKQCLQSPRPYDSAATEVLVLLVFREVAKRHHEDELQNRGSARPYLPLSQKSVARAAEDLLEQLRLRLQVRSSSGAEMLRFKAFCEWYGKRRVSAILGGLNEAFFADLDSWDGAAPRPAFRGERELHDFLNEFFFHRGFFPFVRFKLFGDEPDSLLFRPPAGAGTAEFVPIEVKQYLRPATADGTHRLETQGRWPSPSEVKNAVSQTVRYCDQLRAAGVICDHAALVLFYGGAEPTAAVLPSVVEVGSYMVSILPVYLGDGHASHAGPPIRWETTEGGATE